MFGSRSLAALCTASLIFVSSPVATAQVMSAELKALDEQLPGDLINDPTRIDWEVYGNEVSSEPVIDQSIPGGGAALQIDVRNATEYIYTAGLNMPLVKGVDAGDDVTIGFYARTIEASPDDGNGVIRIRFQQNAAPYPGFGEKTLSIGKDWQWYEVTAKAERALRKKDGIVAVQFGRTKQVLQIGQTIIVKGASAIAGKPAAPAPKPVPQPSMPKSLQGAGTLLNDSSKADWYFEGSAGEYATLEDVLIFGTVATRFTTTKADSRPHDLFATVPLNTAIAEGDELLIAVAARSVAAEGQAIEAQVGLRLEEAKPPYDGFGDNQISVSQKWRLIRVKTKATRALAAGEGQLAIHFGGALKTVDVGPVYILKTN